MPKPHWTWWTEIPNHRNSFQRVSTQTWVCTISWTFLISCFFFYLSANIVAFYAVVADLGCQLSEIWNQPRHVSISPLLMSIDLSMWCFLEELTEGGRFSPAEAISSNGSLDIKRFVGKHCCFGLATFAPCSGVCPPWGCLSHSLLTLELSCQHGLKTSTVKSPFSIWSFYGFCSSLEPWLISTPLAFHEFFLMSPTLFHTFTLTLSRFFSCLTSLSTHS